MAAHPLLPILLVIFLNFAEPACVHNNDCGRKEVCEFGMCFPSVNLTEECSFTTQCQVEDEYSLCNDNRCTCMIGYTVRGAPCAASLDMITSDPYFDPDNNDIDEDSTTVARNWDPPTGRPWETPDTTTHKPECYYDSQCKPGHVCAYDAGCLPMRGIYENCKKDVQCYRQISMTQCNEDSYCSCYLGLYYNGTQCVYDDVHSFPKMSTSVVLPIVAVTLGTVVPVAIGLIVFFLVRRTKRRRATKEFQEKNNHIAQVFGDNGPLPTKQPVLELASYHPEMYPKL